MKIITLNSHDSGGGSANSAYRLHRTLLQLGVDVELLVLQRSHHEKFIHQPENWMGRAARSQLWRIDVLPLKLYPYRERYYWSLNWFPHLLHKWIKSYNADLYHVHWIGGGYIPISHLKKLRKPIIWTLRDSWAFTGGCHIPLGCERYLNKCGNCPHLKSRHEMDVSRLTWINKSRIYPKLDLTVVAPSHWLSESARASSLLKHFRVETIPNGIDIGQFKPLDQYIVRAELGLSLEKKYIVFGAFQADSDHNKGFHLLLPALQRLAILWKDRAEILIFGADAPDQLRELGLPARYMGTIRDPKVIAKIYAAADVCVVPSLSENFPNVILEALACGTPSVGFDIGGIPDLIEHQRNGYLARPYEVDDLANGIDWVLSDDERHQQLSARAREKVEAEFDIRHVAQRYLALYNEVLEGHRAKASE